MNQGRIWCVVNPTVGLPLFLGSVAITSLIVHYSVLSNTTWFGQYWNGKAKPVASAPADATSTVATNTANGFVITVSQLPTSTAKADTSFVVSVAAPSDQLALAGASAK